MTRRYTSFQDSGAPFVKQDNIEIGRLTVVISTCEVPDKLLVATRSSPIILDIKDVCEKALKECGAPQGIVLEVIHVRKACLVVDLTMIIQGAAITAGGGSAFLVALPRIKEGFELLLDQLLKIEYIGLRTRVKIRGFLKKLQIKGIDVIEEELKAKNKGK